MFISVIIVTFNNQETIKDCLVSIRKNLKIPHEIIIFDNHSQDKTVEKIHQSGVKIRLFPQKENQGFSAANNSAVQKASGDYLLFLNPDARILNIQVRELFRFMDQHPEVVMVAPRLIDGQGRIQPSVRKLPSLGGAIKEYLLGMKNSYESYYPAVNQPVEVESVVGAAMVISKANYQNLKGFDNKYFMYFEDLDLCRKIYHLGGKIYYLPKVVFEHKIGSSASSNPQVKRYIEQSFFCYHGLIPATILKLIFFINRINNYLKREKVSTE